MNYAKKLASIFFCLIVLHAPVCAMKRLHEEEPQERNVRPRNDEEVSSLRPYYNFRVAPEYPKFPILVPGYRMRGITEEEDVLVLVNDGRESVRMSTMISDLYKLSRSDTVAAQNLAFERLVALCSMQADAQALIGGMLLEGRGVECNVSQAIEWLKKAADQGVSCAMLLLGEAYRDGEGVLQDVFQAISWFEKSAEQGDGCGMHALGQMYLNGLGVVQDFDQALYWLRRAVEQGNMPAHNDLAYMYCNGCGVDQSYSEAARLLRRAELCEKQSIREYAKNILEHLYSAGVAKMPIKYKISDGPYAGECALCGDKQSPIYRVPCTQAVHADDTCACAECISMQDRCPYCRAEMHREQPEEMIE